MAQECSKFLYHVASYSSFFSAQESPPLHEVVQLKFKGLDDEEKVAKLVPLLSKYALKGRDIVLSSDQLPGPGQLELLFYKNIGTYSRISPISLLNPSKENSLLREIYPIRSSLGFEERGGLNALDNFYIRRLRSNFHFKRVELYALTAYAIATSSGKLLGNLAIQGKIRQYLELVQTYIKTLIPLISQASPCKQQAHCKNYIYEVICLIKECCKKLANQKPFGNEESFNFFRELCKRLSTLLSQIIIAGQFIDIPSITVNIIVLRPGQIINPKFQHMWRSRAYSFLLEQNTPQYSLYTDASVKFMKCGSFSGVLTLETGHILHHWNFRIREVIPDCNFAELFAIVFALCQIKDIKERVVIQTDSEVAIQTLFSILKNNPIKWDYENISILAKVVRGFPRAPNILIQHVKGHGNCSGNSFADSAAAFAHESGQDLSWVAWAQKKLGTLHKTGDHKPLRKCQEKCIISKTKRAHYLKPNTPGPVD